MTKKQRENVSRAHLGQTAWNKGKKWSKATKEKMSEAKKKNPVRYWLGKKRLDMTGENNPNYKKFGKEHPKWTEDKKHSFHKSIRELFKYRQWRLDIFKRDNFTCIKCGKNKTYFEADHYPKRFIDIINENKIKTIDEALNCEELWNAKGRTLCKKCHLEESKRLNHRSSKISSD